jgi:hypothetical protein
MAELVRCEVMGPFPVVCAKTGQDVMAGAEVWLDPDKTNIPVHEGIHWKVLPAKPAKGGKA